MSTFLYHINFAYILCVCVLENKEINKTGSLIGFVLFLVTTLVLPSYSYSYLYIIIIIIIIIIIKKGSRGPSKGA